jgi:hypothetical protein
MRSRGEKEAADSPTVGTLFLMALAAPRLDRMLLSVGASGFVSESDMIGSV